MAQEKTFTYGGVSDLKGEYKIRFCNAIERVKVLDKGGHVDIRIVEFPEAMDKLAGARYLLDLPEFADEAAKYAISDCITAEEAKLSKAQKPVKVKVVAEVVDKPVVDKPVVEAVLKTASIAAAVNLVESSIIDEAELEDLPY